MMMRESSRRATASSIPTLMRAASRLAAGVPAATIGLRMPARAALAATSRTQKRWNQQASAESHLFDENDTLRRRLLYRSKQRGWLEMDLMLGAWVRAHRASHAHATRVASHTTCDARGACRLATTSARLSSRS